MKDLRNNFALYIDFYQVVLNKGFSNASKNLYISQSTLSRNVQKLEELYNTKLILRLQSGIKLTKQGEKVYNAINELLQSLGANDLIIDNDIFTIGTTQHIADYYLKNILKKFHDINPKIKLSIITADAKTLKELLINHEIDIVLDYLPFNYNVGDTNIRITPLTSFRTCFACSKKYYSENASKLRNIADINKNTLIVPGNSRRRQILDEFLFTKKINIEPEIQMTNSKLMVNLIRSGLGVGYFIYEELIDYLDELQIIGDINDYPKNTIGMIYFEKYMTKNLISFIDVLKGENDEKM